MLSTKYQIGNFDRYITIIRKVVTINAFNGESETRQVFKRRKAKEENQGLGSTGNEVVQADKITATRKTTLIVRYDSTINEEMQIVMDSKVYDIISIKSPDGNRRRFLALECAYLEGETFTESVTVDSTIITVDSTEITVDQE